MSDNKYERFKITDYDLANVFSINPRKRSQTKHQQIYGIWSADSETEDEEVYTRQHRKKAKDYSAPIRFVAGGIQQAGRKDKIDEQESYPRISNKGNLLDSVPKFDSNIQKSAGSWSIGSETEGALLGAVSRIKTNATVPDEIPNLNRRGQPRNQQINVSHTDNNKNKEKVVKCISRAAESENENEAYFCRRERNMKDHCAAVSLVQDDITHVAKSFEMNKVEQENDKQTTDEDEIDEDELKCDLSIAVRKDLFVSGSSHDLHKTADARSICSATKGTLFDALSRIKSKNEVKEIRCGSVNDGSENYCKEIKCGSKADDSENYCREIKCGSDSDDTKDKIELYSRRRGKENKVICASACLVQGDNQQVVKKVEECEDKQDGYSETTNEDKKDEYDSIITGRGLLNYDTMSNLVQESLLDSVPRRDSDLYKTAVSWSNCSSTGDTLIDALSRFKPNADILDEVSNRQKQAKHEQIYGICAVDYDTEDKVVRYEKVAEDRKNENRGYWVRGTEMKNACTPVSLFKIGIQQAVEEVDKYRTEQKYDSLIAKEDEKEEDELIDDLQITDEEELLNSVSRYYSDLQKSADALSNRSLTKKTLFDALSRIKSNSNVLDETPNQYRRRQTKHQQIYGIWAGNNKNEEDESEAEDIENDYKKISCKRKVDDLTNKNEGYFLRRGTKIKDYCAAVSSAQADIQQVVKNAKIWKVEKEQATDEEEIDKDELKCDLPITGRRDLRYDSDFHKDPRSWSICSPTKGNFLSAHSRIKLNVPVGDEFCSQDRRKKAKEHKICGVYMDNIENEDKEHIFSRGGGYMKDYSVPESSLIDIQQAVRRGERFENKREDDSKSTDEDKEVEYIQELESQCTEKRNLLDSVQRHNSDLQKASTSWSICSATEGTLFGALSRIKSNTAVIGKISTQGRTKQRIPKQLQINEISSDVGENEGRDLFFRRHGNKIKDYPAPVSLTGERIQQDLEKYNEHKYEQKNNPQSTDEGDEEDEYDQENNSKDVEDEDMEEDGTQIADEDEEDEDEREGSSQRTDKGEVEDEQEDDSQSAIKGKRELDLQTTNIQAYNLAHI